jgi:APA family basic amino acid/polyamine antiporter
MTTSAAEARPYGFWTATALVVGGMIGSGIFLMPIALAPYGMTGIVAWVVSIVGALAIAWCVASLARALPGEPGVLAAVGAVLGPLAGVLVGTSYWVSVWAANAAIAIAATSYLAVPAPVLAATPLTGALVSVALIWLLTLLNLGGARLAGRFQVLTTLLKLLPLLLVIVVAAVIGAGGVGAVPRATAGAGVGGFATAVALTLFPLVGFEVAGVAAERVRDPARNVVRATMLGTAVVGLLYLAVCAAIVLRLPADAIAASGAPFQLFVERFVGRGAGLAVSAFAAIAAIGALGVWVLLQGEVPLGMARAGLLPAWFGRVSRRDVPVRMLVLSSGAASLLVLSNASASLAGVFEFAALLTTCACLWLYLAVCVAALRRRVAVAAAAIGLPFTLFAFWGAGWQASGLSLLLMLCAVPLYLGRPGKAALP